MKLKTWIVCALSTALLLVNLRAAAPIEDVFVAEAKKSAVRVRITHHLRVLLPTPTVLPNHEWQILSNDARFARPINPPKLAPGEKSDTPGGVTWATSFLALRPGRSILRVAYVRASNSGEEVPAEIREIAITVHSDPEPKAP